MHFTLFHYDFRTLGKGLVNGSSEMIGMLALSVTMIAMNNIVMRIVGTNGVAAAAIVLSAESLFSSLYTGYSEGIAPVISYNYGKNDTDNLKKLYKSSIRIIAIISLFVFLLSFPLARPIAMIFSDGSKEVEHFATNGIFVSSIAYALMGFNVFASSLFTAFNDGKISAMLAVFRTFVFLIIPLVSLPFLFEIWNLGIWGVWVSLPVCEVCSVILSTFLLKKKKVKYQY